MSQSVSRRILVSSLVALLALSLACGSRSESEGTANASVTPAADLPRLCAPDCEPYCGRLLDDVTAPNGPLCKAIPTDAATRTLTIFECAGRILVKPSAPRGTDLGGGYLFDPSSHRFIERMGYNDGGWLQCGTIPLQTCVPFDSTTTPASPRVIDCAGL